MRTTAQLTLEAEALTICNDHAMWDEWIESLSDSEWLIYQRWTQAQELKHDNHIQALIELARMEQETRQMAIEVLEKLSDYMGPQPKIRDKRLPVERKRYMRCAIPSYLHLAPCRMKPLRQYRARI